MADFILPTEPVGPTGNNPKKLFIFSHTKTGKTSSVMQLPNNLLIDLESGADFYSGLKIDVKKFATENKVSMFSALGSAISALKKKEQKYDYITIDTVTTLEDISCEYALSLYKQSPLGKNFTGASIVNLANGAGYSWIREAFEKIYDSFEGQYNKGIIFLGHVKTSSMMKDGESISARDINLTGKLKYILSADVDAIGFMYRHKETNKNIISFKTTETDLCCGARPPHLKGNEFILSEEIDGKLITYRDRIFLPEITE